MRSLITTGLELFHGDVSSGHTVSCMQSEIVVPLLDLGPDLIDKRLIHIASVTLLVNQKRSSVNSVWQRVLSVCLTCLLETAIGRSTDIKRDPSPAPRWHGLRLTAFS